MVKGIQDFQRLRGTILEEFKRAQDLLEIRRMGARYQDGSLNPEDIQKIKI